MYFGLHGQSCSIDLSWAFFQPFLVPPAISQWIKFYQNRLFAESHLSVPFLFSLLLVFQVGWFDWSRLTLNNKGWVWTDAPFDIHLHPAFLLIGWTKSSSNRHYLLCGFMDCAGREAWLVVYKRGSPKVGVGASPNGSGLARYSNSPFPSGLGPFAHRPSPLSSPLDWFQNW